MTDNIVMMLIDAYNRGLADGKKIGYKIGVQEWDAYESDMKEMAEDG